MAAAADGRPGNVAAKPLVVGPLEDKLSERLVASGMVDAAALARARHLAARDGERLWRIAPRLGLVAEDTMAALLGEIASLEVIGASDMPKAPLEIAVSHRFLKEYGLVPLAETEQDLIVAAADPEREFALRALA